MNERQLNRIRQWFDSYVAGFYRDGDDFLNANIELKDKHSRRVCSEIIYLADELGLSKEQKIISEVIGLLHDIGRFSQFQKYRTYNDPRSINHCRLGIEVIQQHKVLDDIPPQERQWINTAIVHHGDKQLPAELDSQSKLYCQLIRDADKLDIYRVVVDYYEQYRRDPDSFKLEIELPDEPWYSPEILRAVLAGQLIDYKSLRTWNDCKLIQLSWVYDVNFTPTLVKIKKEGFLEKIIDFLPQNEDIEQVRKRVLNYINTKINEG